MRNAVVRAVLVVWLLAQGIRLLLEPAQHVSVITSGIVSVFMAGALAALTACEVSKRRRERP